MLNETKVLIKNSVKKTAGNIKIDLSLETLSIADYNWLFEEVNKSSHINELVLPAIPLEDANAILQIVEKRTVKNNVLTSMNLTIAHSDEYCSTEIISRIKRIQSRLQRNENKIFGICGGGNIGLGLIADIISKSGMGYQIRATTNNQLKSSLINGSKKVWLRCGSVNEYKTICVDNVEMVSRDSKSVSLLLEESCLFAICVTPSTMPLIAKNIASGLINRYRKDGSGLKILILMNIPNCAEFVHDHITTQIKHIIPDELEAAKILAGVEFVPTVIDRIVTPLTKSQIKADIVSQLERISSQALLCHFGDINIESIATEPHLLMKAVASFNLQVALFNAEETFSMYVSDSFIEAKRFRYIRVTSDLKIVEELKNKYINGPHAVLAWLGALKGYQTIADTIHDQDLYTFVKTMMQREIKPVLMAAYNTLSENDFDSLETDFFERCRASKEDTVKRVGRDPMRKLNKEGRIRGIIELAKECKKDIVTPRLELGIAAGILYGLKDYDLDNPGCQKLKEIYKFSNESLVELLCYQGAAPSGYFTGFDILHDRELIERVAGYFIKISKGLANVNNLIPSLVMIKNSNELRLSIATPIKSGVPTTFKMNAKESLKYYSIRRSDQMIKHNDLHQQLLSLGIKLDQDGHLYYMDNFTPLTLSFNLVFVRHGETFGNCGQSTLEGKIDYNLVEAGSKDPEKRIFQGNVDTEINQLTKLGIEQSQEVAKKLQAELIDQGWIPDIIFHSPLKRARDTALPFVSAQQMHDRFQQHDGIVEMSFGAWDNKRVCDLSSDDPCHLFYREQHALVKCSTMDNNAVLNAENFAEVLLRAHQVLMDLNPKCRNKKILMFSHSMFGAACCILLGRGQQIEKGEYLAFDGKREDGSYYTMPNATPIKLNFDIPCPTYKKAL